MSIFSLSLIALIVLLVVFYRYIPWHLLRPDLWPFIRQAKADQKETDYPGCCRGYMFCRSTSCGCPNESQHSELFLLARASKIKKGDI